MEILITIAAVLVVITVAILLSNWETERNSAILPLEDDDIVERVVTEINNLPTVFTSNVVSKNTTLEYSEGSFIITKGPSRTVLVLPRQELEELFGAIKNTLW